MALEKGQRRQRMMMAVGIVGMMGIGGAVACRGPAGNGPLILGPTGPSIGGSILLVPSVLLLYVGQSAPLSASVDGIVREDESLFAWTSNEPLVAAVQPGRVTCLSPGTTGIQAAEIQNTGLSPGAAVVQCRSALELSASRIEHVHVVGESPCPDYVGDFEIKNVSDAPVTVEVETGFRALVADRGRVTLGPGEIITVGFRFDCSTRDSFGQLVRITTITESGASEVHTVEVIVSIRG